jgi:hypothetical protein
MKQNFTLLVLLLASLACNAALGGNSTSEPPSNTVDQPPTAIAPPTQMPGRLIPDTPTLTPETLPLNTIQPDTLEHKWAARSFSEPRLAPIQTWLMASLM